jgi:glycosyltransferase involved in cell wall biosynthesis
MRPRILISLMGMTGPPSGAWTRFDSLFPPSAELLSDVDFTVLSDSPAALSSCADLPNVNVTVQAFRPGTRSLPQRSMFLRSVAGTLKPDVLHLETFAALPPRGFRSCVTLHDLRDFTDQLSWQQALSTYAKRLAKSHQLKNAGRVIAISEWTSSEAQRLIGLASEKIAVVPNPIPAAPDLRQIEAAPVEALRHAERYALALGHLEPRKNLEVLISAARTKSWPANCPLVIAGRNLGDGDRLHYLAQGAHATIIFLDPVSEATKWALLANASCVLLPSTLEGFGLLALEAPAVGTPVIASDSSALAEVVGTAETRTDPHSALRWALLVARTVDDPLWANQRLKEQQVWNRRFGAREMARRLEQVYRLLLGTG